MVILDIGVDWYFFLVFVGLFLAIVGIVLFRESRSDKEEILHINPLIVVRNIILNQIGFYLFYLLVAFTIDIVGFEVFWWTQVFTAVEFDFITKRGLLTGLSLILTLAASSIITSSTVQTYRNMLDYCFTVFIIHFIVVSIVAGDFPAYGAWWVANAVGVTLFMILSERLSYYLETMSYQSSLHEAKYKSKKSKKEETNLPTIDERDNHFNTAGSWKQSESDDQETRSKRNPKETSDIEEGHNEQDESREQHRSLKNSTDNNGMEEKGTSKMESIDKNAESLDSSSSSSLSSAQMEEKEKKNSLRKRSKPEERHLEESSGMEENITMEEIPVKQKRTSSEKKIPPNVKGHQLKEEETGKKDSSKVPKSKEELKESPESVQLEFADEDKIQSTKAPDSDSS